MEKWQTSAVTLIEDAFGAPAQTLVLACHSVAWHPAPDIPGTKGDQPARGFLLVSGADIQAARALPWVPTRLRFDAPGCLEARMFEVQGLEVDEQKAEVKFHLPQSP